MAVNEKGFKTSLEDFSGSPEGGIKMAGEGAAPAEYEWGWGNDAMPDSEAGFEEIWQSRQTSDQTTTSGSLAPPGGNAGGDFSGGGGGLVKEAMRYIGTPYVWGGNTPLGFDCSGFTSYVYKNVLGITLPRISYQQGNGGQGVGRDEMRPGDLVFWDNSNRNNGADHVGIYIGNNQFIAAPEPGQSVKVSSLYGDYWARRYTQ